RHPRLQDPLRSSAGRQVQVREDDLVPLGEIPQLLLNGVVAGAVLAVPAIGFTAIYAVLRFPNFTVASHATIGAFAGYVVNTAFRWRAGAAVLVAFLVAGAAGVVDHHLAHPPPRPSRSLPTPIGPD